MAKDDEELKNPFFGRMEAPGQLPGNWFSLGLKLNLVLRSHSLGELRHLVNHQEMDSVWD